LVGFMGQALSFDMLTKLCSRVGILRDSKLKFVSKFASYVNLRNTQSLSALQAAQKPFS